jgi:hypothetical protein
MNTGPAPAPRKRLNPALRRALLAAIGNGQRAWMLATICGWPQAQLFSTQLHARRIPATRAAVDRLTRAAAAVGFTGALFLEEEEQP